MEKIKTVMIPGPTPVIPEIRREMGKEITAFGDPEFVADYKAVNAALKEILHCSGEVFVVAGTGTMAMEMAIANSTKRGDAVLVVSHGFFGDRFIEICERKGLETDVLKAEWGKIAEVSEIEQKLTEKKYAAVTVTHVDTSTGVCAPVAEIGELMRRFPETLYIVDGVCATAGEPEYFDEMNFDILFTGTQKAFGVCPGLMMLWASKKAMERRASLGVIPEYYIDFDKWLPIMHEPSKYFATPAVNLVWALKKSVELIQEEGVEARYSRHAKTGRAVQAGLQALGFRILAEPEHRAVTLSNLIYPDGIDDLAFRNLLIADGVFVAGGLGAYAGKMFRMGHMGNAGVNDFVTALGAIERALAKLGMADAPGIGMAAFTKELMM